ncbi:MAG: aspartate aminotransferase family protein [Candidatus Methylomirabilales bacterium]
MNQTETVIALTERYVANTYRRYPVALTKGAGCRVWDIEGKGYLDFVGGIAVCTLGHVHPRLTQAIQAQAGQLLHVSNLYHIPTQAALAQLLCEHSFADRVFFCNSGAEANEAAIKLARKYATEHLAADRAEIITMRGSFHGRTIATLTATAQEKYQRGFGPLLPGFTYVPFDDLESVERAMDSGTAAVLVEPVQGEGGVRLPSEGYLAGLRKLCDDRDALLIFDEIQTGMGRTGTLFAYQRSGIEPDILTLAKGLAGGLPIGAMLAREEVMAVLTPGTHATTFGGNPLVTAVGLATLTTILDEGLPAQAAARGRYLLDALERLRQKYPIVKEVRGAGLLVGIELTTEARPLTVECLSRGLLVSTAGETVVRMVPPLIVSELEIDEALAILDQGLTALC